MKNIFLLDMDDTLLDFLKAERANLAHTFRAVGVDADEKMIARFHAINDGLWKALERGEISREALKVRRFGLFFEAYNIPADPAAAAREYITHFPEVCFPFDGAAEFLGELKRRGRVYLVTNGGTLIQTAHIAAAGFAPFLDGAFISEEMGVDKPSLAFADYVEAHIANYRRESAVWIGDSLTSDGACADARGIDFILFASRGAPAGYPRRCAENYRDVLTYLDEM